MGFELLKQVRVLDPVAQTEQVQDVLVGEETGEETIVAIAPELSSMPDGTIVHQAQDWVLGPGLIDLYSHSGEPGFEQRETWQTLNQAALIGGFTQVGILPDMVPPLDNPAALAQLRTQAQTLQLQAPQTVQFHYWGALTQGVQGQQMTEAMDLAGAGVVGFSDGQPLQDWTLVRRVLEYLHPLGKPIALWPCDRSLAAQGSAREGTIALQLGLLENPVISETVALAGLLECVAATGTSVHLMRISTARSLDLIAQAKDQGLPITASTTWLHLLRHTGHLTAYDPNLRLDPPLGNLVDRAALIEGLATGVIDAIAVDHSPYTLEEKNVAFGQAPPGAIGLELALPLLWQALVASGQWSGLELWQKLSVNPARCLGTTCGSVAVGQPLELTLFDPHQAWTVNPGNLGSRSQNTAWLGQEMTGRVIKTYLAPDLAP
jgi:dihydroorotase